MSKALTWIGGIGAAVGLLCCLTPLLPAVLTGLGLAGLIDTLYRDAILLPFAAVSLALFGVGVLMLRRSQ